MPGPILFCYDGSDGSREAIRAAASLLDHSNEAVVLTVWQPSASILARSAPFGPVALSDEAEAHADEAEAEHAAAAAREGVEHGESAGWRVTARVERSETEPAKTILEVADELDASLIVSGRRGRGRLPRRSSAASPTPSRRRPAGRC